MVRVINVVMVIVEHLRANRRVLRHVYRHVCGQVQGAAGPRLGGSHNYIVMARDSAAAITI